MIGPQVAAVALTASVLLLACGDGGGADDPECGDSVCQVGETSSSCPQDCSCGNGTIDWNEQCDSGDFGGATCETQGRGPGALICNSDCSFNYSGCAVNECGDGVVQTGEECDGGNLNESTCELEGFSTGDLSCNENCTFNTDSCCNDFCSGDGVTRCDGDLFQTCTVAATGCLIWNSVDCTDTDYVCEDDPKDDAMCVCFDTCSQENDTRCDGDGIDLCTLQGDGCLKWLANTDCSSDSETCAVGPQGAVCVPTATGEDCSDTYPLIAGLNVVAWEATVQDYLPSSPSCSTTSTTGPDIVMEYTATSDGFIDVSMDKPVNNRFYLVAASSACGTPTPELLCLAEYGGTVQQGSFSVSANTTYYLYATDSLSGSNPLPNPLFVTITENDCATFDASATNLTPAHGTVTNTLSPTISVEFTAIMDTTVGTVTVVGDMGTNLSYDLSTSPSAITWSSDDKTMTIITGSAFPSGESVTVSWTGLQDVLCQNVATPPPWTFQIIVTPCAPGTNGMIGATQTRYATTISSLSEYYVVADDNPTGWVYVGATSALWRMPKGGGTIENVYAAAGLTTSHLGYEMLIVGDNIFTLESKTTGTTGHLWRISTNGGTTWTIEDFATFPSQPNDDFRAMTYYNGRIYLMTDESTTTVTTQIWSVDANPITLPTTAVLEGFFDEHNCNGLAMDDINYYVACGSGERLVSVDRTTSAVQLLTSAYDMSSTKNSVYAVDLDADGIADVIYFQSFYEKGWFVCDPTTLPYVDQHFEMGVSSGNYGMGMDSIANTLWMWDDDTKEFVSIQ